MNDVKISHIGDYIKNVLDPKVLQHTESLPNAFKWEYYHAADAMRTPRKVFQTVIDMLVFVVPSIIAIGGYWLFTRQRQELLAEKPFTGPTELFFCDWIAVILGIALTGYFVQIIYYSRYGRVRAKESSN